MPTWLWEIIIGVIVVGLTGLVYKLTVDKLVDKICSQGKRVDEVMAWIRERPTKDEILTKSTHAEICHNTMKELADLIKGQYHETKLAIQEKHLELKESLDKINDIVGIDSNRLTSIETQIKLINGNK